MLKPVDYELDQVQKTVKDYGGFANQQMKKIDKDFEVLINTFTSIATTAKNYLKNSIDEECKQGKQRLAELTQNITKLKTSLPKKEKKDDIVDISKGLDEKKVEKLVNRNSEVNQVRAAVRHLSADLTSSFNEKVYYKINKSSDDLFDVLNKLLTNFSLRFFKKFKLMLVRPKLEEIFNSQLDMLKIKILDELEPKVNINKPHIPPVTVTAPEPVVNDSMTNESGLFNLRMDLGIVQETVMPISPYVLAFIDKFGDFKIGKKINNPNFVNLVDRPAVVLEDGSIYEGQWDQQNCRTGRGRCIMLDSTFYDGYWVKGEPQVLGRFIRPNGELYEGLIKNGKANGKGVLVNMEGYKYVGYWQDDKRHGSGEETFPNNTTYQGEFLYDMHHGHGVQIMTNKSYYQGEFFENKFNGVGEFVWPSGERYRGDWVDDKKHGSGEYLYEDGRVYIGDFFNDIPHGFGKLIQPDGREIESFWKEGRPVGIGMKGEENNKETIMWDTEEITEDNDISLIE